MKKTVSMLLVILLFVSLCGCGSVEKNAPAAGTPLHTFYEAILDVQPEDAEALILFEESNPI